MTLRTPDNWALDSYTDATWTTLVGIPAVVASVSICNTTGGAINVELRMAESGVSHANILPTASIPAGEAYSLDMRSLVVKLDQALQIRADAPGLEFLASGANEGITA